MKLISVLALIMIVFAQTSCLTSKRADMIVKYKILNADNTEYKTGEIKVEDKNQTLSLRMFQSLKKKTWQYLDQYDAAIAAMSKIAVDKLNNEL
jgi:hypothetical protein